MSEPLLQFKPSECTILVVDDNAANLGVISDYLGSYGFEILTARSGEMALKRVEYTRPDIILMDVMMPGLNGFETCQTLKLNEKTRDIPVIFMTALAGTEDKVKGFQAGGVDYVTKPIQQEEVLARVTAHLRIGKLLNTLNEQRNSLQEAVEELQHANLKLTRRAVQIETSNQIGQEITSILDMKQLLPKVLSITQTKFGYSWVSVWLVNESGDMLVLEAGTKSSVKLGTTLPSTHQGLVGQACRTGEMICNNHAGQDPAFVNTPGLPFAFSEIALPLKFQKQLMGILDIQSERLQAYDPDDIAVLQITAMQISIAIHNARLYAR